MLASYTADCLLNQISLASESLVLVGVGNMHAAECSPNGVVALCQCHMMWLAVCHVYTARQQQKGSGPVPLASSCSAVTEQAV